MPRRPRSARRLRSLARDSGDPFRTSEYFDIAEPHIEEQWETLIWPRLAGADFTRVVDLAAGHGRNSAKLQHVARNLILVDINEECLAVCRARFGDDPRFSFLRTDGYSLSGIADESVTLVYSFDAMVHFAPEVVGSYLQEIARVLVRGGHGFCHHSNYSENPGGDFRQAPHWRNHMSLQLFATLSREAGLEVVSSEAIDWGCGREMWPGLDGLTLLLRP